MDTWLIVQSSNKNHWIVWNRETFHAIGVCMFACNLLEWISNLKVLPHGENWFLVTCGLDWLLPAISSSIWQTWPPTVKGIVAVKWRKSSRMLWHALFHSYHLLTSCSNKLALWRAIEQCTSQRQSLLWPPCNIRSKQSLWVNQFLDKWCMIVDSFTTWYFFSCVCYVVSNSGTVNMWK